MQLEFFEENLQTDEENDDTPIRQIDNINSKKSDQNMPKIKILVACHKAEMVVTNEIISPIAVGVENGNPATFELADNDGDDNISHLNGRFCELTAQYWAYKNLDADYYGFFHYRRYLSFRHFDTKCQINIPGIYNNIEQDFGLNEADISAIVSKADVILPVPYKTTSNYNQYKVSHDIADLDFCLRYIAQKYPEFNPAVQKYMNSLPAYQNNIFIAKKEIFKEYCAWAFDILMAFDAQKDYNDLDEYQMRTVGFLGERLLGIFMTHIKLTRPQLKILHAPTLFIKDTHNNTPHVAKDKYKARLGDVVTDMTFPRGTRRREFCKKVYTTLLGRR